MAISQSLGLIGTLQHAVKRSGEMISHVAAVERIVQYTNLPKEASWTSDNPPPADWPKHGQVTLNNVSMKYDKEEAPVLKVIRTVTRTVYLHYFIFNCIEIVFFISITL